MGLRWIGGVVGLGGWTCFTIFNIRDRIGFLHIFITEDLLLSVAQDGGLGKFSLYWFHHFVCIVIYAVWRADKELMFLFV